MVAVRVAVSFRARVFSLAFLVLQFHLGCAQSLDHEEEMHAFLGSILKLPQWQQQELREFKQKLADENAKAYMRKLKSMGLSPPGHVDEPAEEEPAPEKPKIMEVSKPGQKKQKVAKEKSDKVSDAESREKVLDEKQETDQKLEKLVPGEGDASPSKVAVVKDTQSLKQKTEETKNQKRDLIENEEEYDHGALSVQGPKNDIYEFFLFSAFTACMYVVYRVLSFVCTHGSNVCSVMEGSFYMYVDNCASGKQKGLQAKVVSKLASMMLVSEACDALGNANGLGAGENFDEEL